MKVMMEFELCVLNDKSYAKLTLMNNNLTSAVSAANDLKESFRVNGEITMASEAEACIIRIKENIDKIKLAMTSKEGDVLESFKLGMEPVSKN